MKKIIISILLLGMIFNSCNRTNFKRDIQNIWVGDYQLTLYFDSTESTYNYLPMLIDLSDSNNATLKYFTGNETNTTWEINDSILTIDTVKYRIISLTIDSLVYSPFLRENEKPKEEPIDEDIITAVPIRDEYYVFKRIKDIKLNSTEKKITELFYNKLYFNSTFDSSATNYGDYLEFFDNGVVIFKIINDNTKNIQLQEECWKIENYKGYSFLVFFHNWYQNNGFMNHSYQILNLSETGFELDRFINNKPSNYQIANIKKDDSIALKMLGKWISINDTAKFYSQYISRKQIELKRYKLYDDTLVYEFYKDSLLISGNGFLPIKCNWELNTDNSMLIFEYLIEMEEFSGYHVEYASIHNLTNDLLDIDLFNNHISTGLEKPQMIILNRNQKFKKTE